jgi:SHS2 domain-containing protein
LFEHTADVGLEVRGETPEDLLRWAAEGLRRVWLPDLAETDEGTAGAATAEPDAPAGTLPVDISGAPDLESLLVDWLNFLIFTLETEGVFPVGCDLDASGAEDGSWTLRGTVRVSRVPPGRPVVAVKGATYHGLAVEPAEGGGLRARVILDI